MTKNSPPLTPERNRLRAAAALIPIIESGLNDGKLHEDRARQLVSFCEWAHSSDATEQDEIALKSVISDGLLRIRSRFDVGAPTHET